MTYRRHGSGWQPLRLRRTLPACTAALAMLVIGSACGFAGTATTPAECRFPAGTPLAFEGRTSLRALKLDLLGPVEYHDDVGMIYVTEDPIVVPGLLPGDRAARMFCMLQPAGDRQVAIGSIPDDWQLPASMVPVK